MSTESPQENYTAVTTGTEGPQAAERDLSPVSGPFPDVRLIPAGELWPHHAAAVRAGSDPRGAWRCTNGAWLADGEVHCHAQRLVPAAALTQAAELLAYLLAQYDRVVGVHEQIRMDTEQDRDLHRRSLEAFRLGAEPVREWIASLDSLAPESPVRKEREG